MQKRVIHIIYPFTLGISYPNILFVAELLLNPDVSNFQGLSFRISVTHPLPAIIYFPLHVIRLSCLGSKQPCTVHASYGNLYFHHTTVANEEEK